MPPTKRAKTAPDRWRLLPRTHDERAPGSYMNPFPSDQRTFDRLRVLDRDMTVVNDPTVRREVVSRMTPAVRRNYVFGDYELHRLVPGRSYVVRDGNRMGVYRFEGFVRMGPGFARMLFAPIAPGQRPLALSPWNGFRFFEVTTGHRRPRWKDEYFDAASPAVAARMNALVHAKARQDLGESAFRKYAAATVARWRERTLRPPSGGNAGGTAFRAARNRFAAATRSAKGGGRSRS